jgi:hypothetical protein
VRGFPLSATAERPPTAVSSTWRPARRWWCLCRRTPRGSRAVARAPTARDLAVYLGAHAARRAVARRGPDVGDRRRAARRAAAGDRPARHARGAALPLFGRPVGRRAAHRSCVSRWRSASTGAYRPAARGRARGARCRAKAERATRAAARAWATGAARSSRIVCSRCRGCPRWPTPCTSSRCTSAAVWRRPTTSCTSPRVKPPSLLPTAQYVEGRARRHPRLCDPRPEQYHDGVASPARDRVASRPRATRAAGGASARRSCSATCLGRPSTPDRRAC